MNVVMKHSKSKKKWLSRITAGLLSMAMLTTNVTSLSTMRAEGQSVPLSEERQVEKLDRGLMAIKVRDGVYLGDFWEQTVQIPLFISIGMEIGSRTRLLLGVQIIRMLLGLWNPFIQYIHCSMEWKQSRAKRCLF